MLQPGAAPPIGKARGSLRRRVAPPPDKPGSRHGGETWGLSGRPRVGESERRLRRLFRVLACCHLGTCLSRGFLRGYRRCRPPPPGGAVCSREGGFARPACGLAPGALQGDPAPGEVALTVHIPSVGPFLLLYPLTGLIPEPPVLTTECWPSKALLQFIDETGPNTAKPETALK